MNNLLFVYGTLMKASRHERHALLAPLGRFVEDGSINGKLFLVSTYPGLILSAASHDLVHGEVYELSAPEMALATLDEYEECSPRYADPTQYVRQEVSVTLASGGKLKAWTYIYNRSVENFQHISSGRFLTMS